MTFICIDVANGYSQFFVEYVKKVRDKFPQHTIMVRSEADIKVNDIDLKQFVTK